MPDITDLGTGAGSGLIGAILGYFGIRHWISRVDKDLQKHKENVVYKETFDATIKPMKDNISEIRGDVKELLRTSKQRRKNDGDT